MKKRHKPRFKTFKKINEIIKKMNCQQYSFEFYILRSSHNRFFIEKMRNYLLLILIDFLLAVASYLDFSLTARGISDVHLLYKTKTWSYDPCRHSTVLKHLYFVFIFLWLQSTCSYKFWCIYVIKNYHKLI